MTFSRSNLTFIYFSTFLLLLLPPLLQALNTDGVILLSFKYSILDDPLSVLQNWNYADATPCSWTGVMCTEIGNPNTADMYGVTSLVLPNNQLLGSVPPSLFSIPNLKSLDLSNNFFNGSLPDSVFNATQLQVLSLSNNKIYGELPETISGMISLQLLNLSSNALTGKIPKNLTVLKNLTVVSLSRNSFSGEIPGGFDSVQILDFSSNMLNGSLPLDFGGRNLQYLNLSKNKVSNSISPAFALKIPVNAIIDLSFNNLTGPIPESLPLLNQKSESFVGNIGLCGKPLKNLCAIPSTLSSPPNFSGTISPAIAVIPKTSDLKNPLGEPQEQATKSKLKPSTIVGIIVADIAGLAILAVFVLYVYQLRKRKTHEEYSTFNVLKECLEKNDTASAKESKNEMRQQHTVVAEASPAKTTCNSCMIIKGACGETSTTDTATSESDIENQVREQESIDAFRRTGGGRLRQSDQTQLITVDGETQLELETLLKASAYILGSSGNGIVYKAVLENGTAFAVRRIGTESCAPVKMKEFEREIRLIVKLRHPNLVRVRGFCWGDDEKLLICDYVPNGSLPSSSYRKPGSSSSPHMSLEVRLKIARGLARGLAYIHEKRHVHGNIKPNNILLNPDMEPVITDLGLDRLLNQTHKTSANIEPKAAGPTPSPTVPPSPYQSPESRDTLKPNQKCDVYSYGIVLLELLTGRVFSTDRDLGQWSSCLTGSVAEEKNRVSRLVDGPIRADVACNEEAALACFRLGFECVSSLPQKRPQMKEVVQVLDKVKIGSVS